MSIKRLNYAINVKIPRLYVEIIDNNLEGGKALSKAGYHGRAQFVSEAVKEKLFQLGLLTEENQRRLEAERQRRRPSRR